MNCHILICKILFILSIIGLALGIRAEHNRNLKKHNVRVPIQRSPFHENCMVLLKTSYCQNQSQVEHLVRGRVSLGIASRGSGGHAPPPPTYHDKSCLFLAYALYTNSWPYSLPVYTDWLETKLISKLLQLLASSFFCPTVITVSSDCLVHVVHELVSC